MKSSSRRGPRYTLRAFAELWMEQHVVPNLAAATQKNYRHFLDARILPALGDILLEDLTPLRPHAVVERCAP